MRTVKNPNDRREEILEGATKLFLDNGFSKTKMEDIVKSLGISKGLIFYYFKSKDELINAVIDRLSTQVAQTVIEDMRADIEFPIKLAKILQHFVNMTIEFNGKFSNMTGDDNLKIIIHFRDLSLQKVEPDLRELMAEGIRRGDIKNVDAFNSVIIVAMGSITYLALYSADEYFRADEFMSSTVNTLELALGMKKNFVAEHFNKESQKELLKIIKELEGE